MKTLDGGCYGAAVLCFCVVLAAWCSCAGADEKEGCVPLFNGKNLDGWRQINGSAKYEVVDGAIVGTTAAGSPNSFLCTEKLYGDFELEFEVMVDPRLNSGVQIRSSSFPEYQRGRVHGYQVEIATGGAAGRIYDEARLGRWLDKDRSDPKARAAFKAEGWNKYRVVCAGNSIKSWVNDVPIADLKDSMTKTGFIGLQVHSFQDSPPAQVRWRGLRLKELKGGDQPKALSPEAQKLQALIDRVEKSCADRGIPMIGRTKAERLAELVRETKPRLVVECGTAVGYSGLWIARELKAAGQGKLITIEIDPARAKEAEGYFKEAGLADIVAVKVGDARKLASEIEGPIDFAFIDCDYGNYHPCFTGLEAKLRAGAVVVADNAGIGASGMAEYLQAVRSKHESHIEWFDVNLPWVARDAMEVTAIKR